MRFEPFGGYYKNIIFGWIFFCFIFLSQGLGCGWSCGDFYVFFFRFAVVSLLRDSGDFRASCKIFRIELIERSSQMNPRGGRRETRKLITIKNTRAVNFIKLLHNGSEDNNAGTRQSQTSARTLLYTERSPLVTTTPTSLPPSSWITLGCSSIQTK